MVHGQARAAAGGDADAEHQFLQRRIAHLGDDGCGLRVGGDGILYAPNAARWLPDHPLIEQRRAQVVEVDGARVRLQDGSRLCAQAGILAGGTHVTVQYLLFALILGHTAAAIWHHRVQKDDVLRAMLPQRGA